MEEYDATDEECGTWLVEAVEAVPARAEEAGDALTDVDAGKGFTG